MIVPPDFDPNTALVADLGISLEEISVALSAADECLGGPRNGMAAELFDLSAVATSDHARDRFIASLYPALSTAGAYFILSEAHNDKTSLPFRELRKRMLRDPVFFSDLSLWCLLLAAHDTSCKMQMDHCRQPTSESHLTGMLLQALGEGCERWRRVVEKPLLRKNLSLRLHRLDLTIGGGEQATGGDFGLVLELAGPPFRIVPLIFQAKRYTRPNADVSQKHFSRGYQLTQLGEQECASAYIFYENGKTAIPAPLPPLVKRVEDVVAPAKTNVLENSVDLATHFLNVLTGPSIPTAATPEEALRMIFARAEPEQLSQLAVIASDETAGARYASANEELEKLRRGGAAQLQL